MRGASLRSLAAFAVGVGILGGILYVASTVDGRPPAVDTIRLTHHLSADQATALTTTSVEVVFSEVVDHASAEQAFTIAPAVDGAFSWNAATLVFTPAERLPLETDFAVTIAPGVRDRSGNEMTEPYELAFVTVGNPTVIASQPEPNADDVPLASPIAIEFSTLMDTASVEAALSIAPEMELSASWAGEVLTLTPAEALDEGTRYTLRISTDARDSAGTPLAGPYALTFRAVRSGLSATATVPADGAEGISVRSPIALMFDRELDTETLDDEQFNIEPEVAGSLDVIEAPGAAGMGQPGIRLLQFAPSSALDSNTTYQVTLQPGLTGTDGAALAAPISWRFTTGSPLATLSNQIVFLSDRGGIDNLWAMNPDGTGQRQVSSELSPISAYAVAPDGRTFVVGDGATLVRQQADGGGRQLLTPDGVLDIDPTYAPDGSEIAFARVDAVTGGGLGLWVRPFSGGDARRLDLPSELGVATPSPRPSGAADLDSILRAPRYSPDGAALAFVDVQGRVGVLELPNGRLTTAPFAAVGPASWLPESTGLLLAGSPGGALEPVAAGQPIPPLDAGGLGLSSFELGSLRLAQLDRGADSVELLDLPPGSSRPEAGSGGRFLFVVVDAGAPGAAGQLRLATSVGGTASVLDNDRALVTSAGFGPVTRSIVVARESPAPEERGVWVVDVITHRGQQLSGDGWLPRWLP